MKRKTKYNISIINPIKVFWREFAPVLRVDTGVDDQLVFDKEAFANAADAADWSDDPGTGRAILLEDGRELLNPVPMEPPVGHDEEPSINALVERALTQHFAKLEKNAEAERTLADILKFDDEGEDDYFSAWELREMEEEIPPIPTTAPPPPPPPNPPPADIVEPPVPPS